MVQNFPLQNLPVINITRSWEIFSLLLVSEPSLL